MRVPKICCPDDLRKNDIYRNFHCANEGFKLHFIKRLNRVKYEFNSSFLDLSFYHTLRYRHLILCANCTYIFELQSFSISRRTTVFSLCSDLQQARSQPKCIWGMEGSSRLTPPPSKNSKIWYISYACIYINYGAHLHPNTTWKKILAAALLLATLIKKNIPKL